jgi:hypothetical protein
MFDERSPSLHAQVRKIECGFVSRTTYSDVQRLKQRHSVA